MPNTGDIVKASDFEAVKPQLSIGTVTTGAAGSNASASITGTSPNFRLNLTIPRGNTGATGATGPQGPSGAATVTLKGTRTTTGNWSITGLSVGKPLYLIASPISDPAAHIMIGIISGTNDTSSRIIGRITIGTSNSYTISNCCIVIPTSSTVVASISYMNDNTILRAYQ